MLKKKQQDSQQSSNDWLSQPTRSILLYGSSKVGKTFAYCSVIEDAYEKGNKCFVLSTDKGFRDTFLAYFGEKAEEVAKFVEYNFVPTIEETYKVMPNIITSLQPNDWIIIDLVSDFWEMAQNKFIEDASGGDPATYITRASKDPKKFGMFNGQMWQYIKQLDDSIVNNVILRANCNVLAVASEKDIEIEKAISGKLSETSKDFNDIGSKPAGQKRLSYKFNSIVHIGKKQNQRHFRIVGIRGQDTSQSPIMFQRNWFAKYKEATK